MPFGTYPVTVYAQPLAGGSVLLPNGSTSQSFIQNSTVVLTASANPNYTFSNWATNSVVVSTLLNYTLTTSNYPVQYTASFTYSPPPIIPTPTLHLSIQNENYGYSVTTDGIYVAVGNPALTRYTFATASLFQTGSVDVFKYNGNTDAHVYFDTIYKPYEPQDYITLTAENGNFLETELLGLDQWNRGLNIAVDNGIYLTMSAEDAYGKALDSYNGKLAVGCEYYWDRVVIGTNTFEISSSCVDVWDYTYTNRTQYSTTAPCVVLGYGLTGSGIAASSFGNTAGVSFGNIDLTKYNVYYQNVQVPPGYDAIQVYASSSLFNPAALVSTIPVTPIGENITYAVSASFAPPATKFAYLGIITAEPVHQHILNPDPKYSSSFGHSVSLTDQWLAIGSPMISSSQGMVYIYQGTPIEGFVSYSLYQKIQSPVPRNGQLFGWSVSLNKSATFDCPYRLVVGAGTASNNSVVLYELSNAVWAPTFTFVQDSSSLYPLTFNTSSYPILGSGSYQSSSFGWSVSTWEDTVVIGAPTERAVFEYSSSNEFNQGTAYIFERCSTSPCGASSSAYQLMQKVYGDQNTLRNNQVGYSVGVYGTNMVIGAPKVDFNVLTSEYLSASIFQLHYCAGDAENSLTGQWLYLTQDTSSNWNYQKTFQKKKRFMSPYRGFGGSVAVGDVSIAVGAPMLISDLTRNFYVPYTSSLGINLDDLMGKSYIYNLLDYHNQVYVGNVWYKNGIVVVNTSGSAFQGLFFNPTTPYTYEYDLSYQSQHTIHEKQIICTVNPGEFNVSTNPSAVVIPTSSWDINNNGRFDFQDMDVLLRFIQYRNTSATFNTSFDWSSSVLKSADEISFYNYQSSQWKGTDLLFSSSVQLLEVSTSYYNLDVNQDRRIDNNDQNLIWKYFSKRLTQKNYLPYVNSNCANKSYNNLVTFMDGVSQRNALPMINPGFASFDAESALDKTGSFLAPMVTTVGLYDGLDLVAVAKLAVPIKLPRTLPINFVVKMDF